MTETAPKRPSQKKQATFALTLALFAAGMLGLSFAAVPLYDLFCRVTGIGGTTNYADMAPETVLDRAVSVRFDSNIAPDLPWRFDPLDSAVSVKIGEVGMARYRVTNTSDQPVTGIATYNVTPHKVGLYFTKLECFCFEDQTLKAGESVVMPVIFYVDPRLDEDKTAREVREITLSYTFHVSDSAEGQAIASAQY